MEPGKDNQSNAYYFLTGGGEMGELTRAYNWGQTGVGAPAGWPQSLRSTVSLILSSKFPMFLWWGQNLIQFYNDAYRPSLGNNGKHPLALGQKGEDCWPEIWHIINPLIQQVLTTGEATWSEDQLVPIYRNGKIEDVYWTSSYSPVRGEEKTDAVLVICTETTEKVLNVKQLETANQNLNLSKQQIEQSEKNFKNMVLQSPVAMCILLGPQHIVEVANQMMVELWGKPVHQVLNRPIFEALPETRHQGLEQVIENVYHTGDTYKAYERPITLTRNGRLETVYQNFVYEAYREGEGTILGVSAICIDVTHQVLARRKIEEVVAERTSELAEANSKLQKSNAQLAQFAYIASHDLQEPVRKVITFANMLEHSLGEIDERSNRYLAKIKESSTRMHTLIRDVLTYSQLSKETENFELVDLRQVIESIKNDFELLIEQKEAVIQYTQLPIVEAIPLQMSQLFGNLISNSLKFSRPYVQPIITISYQIVYKKDVGFLATGSPEAYFNIEVKDNGIGFHPRHAEQVFNIFQRLHGRQDYAGTGIGLAMCKKIAQNHHGDIYATATTENSAVFNILLPCKQTKT